jgi:hypothetical protein
MELGLEIMTTYFQLKPKQEAVAVLNMSLYPGGP